MDTKNLPAVIAELRKRLSDSDALDALVAMHGGKTDDPDAAASPASPIASDAQLHALIIKNRIAAADKKRRPERTAMFPNANRLGAR